ncbi:hypothetical protein [Gillisia hiemivivida]|uniref:Uncharacterized protein n=1 Tax=Gillisia hiemivivida TaxID=291190 RepID=A0A5C6ZXK5_9FLAO|nr:hypothetical protein [Gillisia hiemivivida]TXD95677.1 hypothetical protein ES724_01195 [Gillisia hiemivivida]
MTKEVIEEPISFYLRDDNGAIKIIQAKLIDFLELNGFLNVRMGDEVMLVRNDRNILYRIKILDLVAFIRNTLDNEANREIYDVFARSPGTYIGVNKLQLLKSIEIIDDLDELNSSKFYFQNCVCEVYSDRIEVIENENLEKPIWQNRILQIEYNPPSLDVVGQFETFCKRITGGKDQRFQALKCLIGYLLHRNKEKGEQKAVILYDEKMGVGDKANGRTGKTVIATALSKCREVELFDGKSMKNESYFKNQRINLTTDLLVYDDISKNLKFDIFYSILTTGVEVEKKGKQSFYIPDSKSPKLLITSNYYVNGDGGDSDLGRRYEFEIANHYSKKLKPEHEFGNRFFGNFWPMEEWNKFYFFMSTCVQDYLANGLIDLPSLNLQISKITDNTSSDFVEFAEVYIKKDFKFDKRHFLSDFISLYPKYQDLSPHQFTKWLQLYADHLNCSYEDKSSGGEYYFWIHSKADSNE